MTDVVRQMWYERRSMTDVVWQMYSLIKKDRLNFVRLYFLKNTW